MTPELQHTLASAVQFQGVGIHTGRQVCGRIEPARPDTGVSFVRTDVAERDPEIPARADRVSETRLGTVISNADGVSVSTVEHLMATLSGLAIDNAVVFIDGPEVPIMDGSCAPFVDLLDRAGRRLQARPRRYLEILEPIVVEDGDKRVALTPADRFEVAFEILFDDRAIGRQSLDLAVDEAVFREELAEARTFGFLHEVEALRAAGLARGGSMDNVVVIDRGEVLNPDGLRQPDEFVRHKMLDAIGDMALLGAPLLARYEGRYAGHAMNNALARALLARPAAWREVSAPRRLAAVG
ncbi:MAG TPA: UDP-3-O-acyl-N-acetylglucosamine deacetylase [Caulobacteraceae bacterium]|jgi:UDP-3-O-[3-hydroxymyristoyl] N-acetylglucosamine deacetylase|nr:UDP-3-O-acyl-N-acetylglucosamine deacetylase [Caulobacteraceae bacterium]